MDAANRLSAAIPLWFELLSWGRGQAPPACHAAVEAVEAPAPARCTSSLSCSSWPPSEVASAGCWKHFDVATCPSRISQLTPQYASCTTRIIPHFGGKIFGYQEFPAIGVIRLVENLLTLFCM